MAKKNEQIPYIGEQLSASMAQAMDFADLVFIRVGRGQWSVRKNRYAEAGGTVTTAERDRMIKKASRFKNFAFNVLILRPAIN